jgi:cysteine desulfurase
VAIGIDDSLAHTGIRFSLSRFTTEDEIDYAIEVIGRSVERLRKISTNPTEEKTLRQENA